MEHAAECQVLESFHGRALVVDEHEPFEVVVKIRLRYVLVPQEELLESRAPVVYGIQLPLVRLHGRLHPCLAGALRECSLVSPQAVMREGRPDLDPALQKLLIWSAVGCPSHRYPTATLVPSVPMAMDVFWCDMPLYFLSSFLSAPGEVM